MPIPGLITQPRDLRVNPIRSTKLEHNCSTQNPTSTSKTFQIHSNENGPFFVLLYLTVPHTRASVFPNTMLQQQLTSQLCTEKT